MGNFALGLASSEAVAYSYEKDELADNIVFGKPGSSSEGAWTCGPFRSDAAFLFARCERREITLLAFCSATFVELNGQRVFSSPQIVERFEWSRRDGPSASNQEALAVFDEEMLRFAELIDAEGVPDEAAAVQLYQATYSLEVVR